MTKRSGMTRSLIAAAALCAAAMVATTLTGCLPASTPAATTTPKVPGISALGAYSAAFASARTAAPDVRFLLVQTAQLATTSPPASWTYLFASKSKKQIYLVGIAGGRASAPKTMGTSTLKATDYDKIPSPSAWRVDSAKAFDTAAAEYTKRTGKAPPVEYAMGLATFVPNATSGIKPFVWSVTFAPVSQGAQPTEILVDAQTG